MHTESIGRLVSSLSFHHEPVTSGLSVGTLKAIKKASEARNIRDGDVHYVHGIVQYGVYPLKSGLAKKTSIPAGLRLVGRISARPVLLLLLSLVCFVAGAQKIPVKVTNSWVEKINNEKFLISAIEVSQLNEQIGTQYSYHRGKTELWIGSSRGLFSFDGNELVRFSMPLFDAVKDIFPLGDNQLLLGLSQSTDRFDRVSRLAVFDTRTYTISELSTPVSGNILRWGTDIILFRADQCYQLSRAMRWENIQPHHMLAALISRFNAEYSGGINNHPVDHKRDFIMVKSGIDGCYALDLRFLKNKNGKCVLEKVYSDNNSGLTREILLEIPRASLVDEVDVFYSRVTDEIWLYNIKDGQMTFWTDESAGRIRYTLNLGKYIKGSVLNSIYCDKNNICIGNGHAGFLWITRRPDDNFASLGVDKSVRSIFEDGGVTYVGTYGGLFSFIKSDNSRILEAPKKTDIERVVYSFKSNGERLVMGSIDRIIDCENLRAGILKDISLPYLGEVWCTAFRNDMLILGTSTGIYTSASDPLRWQYTSTVRDSSPAIIYGFIPAGEDEWLAYGDKGIYCIKFKHDSIVSYQPFLELNAEVFYVCRESEKRWWLCTSFGLVAFNPESHTVDQIDGLSFLQGLNVYAAYPDSQGNLWCSTENGIFYINRERNGLYRFTRGDRAKWEFNRNAHYMYPNGDIAFGGVSDLIVFTPGKIGIRTGISENTVSSYLFSDVSAGIDEVEPGLWKLPSGTDHFFIGFRGLYTFTENDRYAYRINGEEGWITGAGLHIKINNLPSGKFTVELFREIEGQWIRLNDIVVQRSWPLSIMAVWVLLLPSLLVGGGYLLFRVIRKRKQASQELDYEVSGSKNSLMDDWPAVATTTLEPENSSNGSAVHAVLSSSAREWKQKLDEVLEIHFTDSDIDANKLARLLFTSRRQLYRDCADFLGDPPMEYVFSFRLRKAAEWLISDPRIQISELAYKTGFKTPSHFSKRFQDKYNMPPKVYAKQVKGVKL